MAETLTRRRTGRPKDCDLVDWDLVSLGSKQDKEIAADLGVSPPAVRMQRIRRGIAAFFKTLEGNENLRLACRRRFLGSQLTLEDNRRMEASWLVEYKSGASYDAIARNWGVSASTICEFVRLRLDVRPKWTLKARSLRTLSDTEFAYIAGLFDGEGSLRVKGYGVQMCIVNTNEDVMAWLESLGGGSIRQRPCNGLGSKPIHIWTVCRHQDLCYLIGGVLPFTIIKREALKHALKKLKERQNEAVNRGIVAQDAATILN